MADVLPNIWPLLPPVPNPRQRLLRVYSVDPSMATRLQTRLINEATVPVTWEPLKPGPIGEYIEVVDYDPSTSVDDPSTGGVTGVFYPPVDLDHPNLLEEHGLRPSDGNPMFHQQMVYAVAMRTIRSFEEALGRRSMWAPHKYVDEKGVWHDDFVRRLRIYPHALRARNAFYSPERKALLFGYFPASDDIGSGTIPGGTVFTCLSFDVVAHETTHALLDGLHPRFIEPSNLDVLAFHEGFADIVALFQHFSLPDLLNDQISRSRGDLSARNLLAQMAVQFGHATGGYGALRDYLGHIDPETHEWIPNQPTGQEYLTTTEAHDRGAVLVAAIFDAFLNIYRNRTGDLLKLATGGSGILRPGEIDPILVKFLADEAAKTAGHVLRMCIRALDYVPPVDINFGDYLRAVITADADLVPNDPMGYRVAFLEAFRLRGIYPRDVRSLGEASLLWHKPDDELDGMGQMLIQLAFDDGQKKSTAAQILQDLAQQHNMRTDRETIYNLARKGRSQLHRKLQQLPVTDHARIEKLLGITLADDRKFEVHSLRPCRRVGPDGDVRTDLVIEITQSVRLNDHLDEVPRLPPDADPIDVALANQNSFLFRGGATLLIDAETGEVRYNIIKNISSQKRRERQLEYRNGQSGLLRLYFGDRAEDTEPFAMLHRTTVQ